MTDRIGVVPAGCSHREQNKSGGETVVVPALLPMDLWLPSGPFSVSCRYSGIRIFVAEVAAAVS